MCCSSAIESALQFSPTSLQEKHLHWEGVRMCRGWESNPHEGLPHAILSRTRLPIPPPRHGSHPTASGIIAEHPDLYNALSRQFGPDGSHVPRV